MHGALPALPALLALLALPALSALSALPALPTIHALLAVPYCIIILPFIDGALQKCVALPVSFKIPFVNSCHVQLSLFLLIYQLGVIEDGSCCKWMVEHSSTSIFLMRRLME